MNFGFAFDQGSFRALDMADKSGVHPFTVAPAPEGTLDAALAATGIPIFALDLRTSPKDGPSPHGSPSLIKRAISAGASAMQGCQALDQRPRSEGF